MFAKILKRRNEKKRAFSRGRLAFSNRIPLENNPFYAKDQELASVWESGWNNGFKTRKDFLKSKGEPIGVIKLNRQENKGISLKKTENNSKIILPRQKIHPSSLDTKSYPNIPKTISHSQSGDLSNYERENLYRESYKRISSKGWDRIEEFDDEEKPDKKKVNRHIPSEVKRVVYDRDGGKCVKCGSQINLHYDHIIPISRGGSNPEKNIQILCEAHNLKKSNKIQ